MQATDVATILRPQSVSIQIGPSEVIGTKNRGHIGGLHGWSSPLGRRLWVQAPSCGSFSPVATLKLCSWQTWTCYTPACITLTDIWTYLLIYMYILYTNVEYEQYIDNIGLSSMRNVHMQRFDLQCYVVILSTLFRACVFTSAGRECWGAADRSSLGRELWVRQVQPTGPHHTEELNMALQLPTWKCP